MTTTKDGFRLSTGREFYAHQQILGMSPRYASEGIYFTNGYDGGDYVKKSYPEDDVTEEWTDAEKREVADYMIKLWNQWAEPERMGEP